jgi:hypothetical protein
MPPRSKRAAKMRALALTMEDQETIILMNDLADDYDRLAERAVHSKPKKKSRNRQP